MKTWRVEADLKMMQEDFASKAKEAKSASIRAEIEALVKTCANALTKIAELEAGIGDAEWICNHCGKETEGKLDIGAWICTECYEGVIGLKKEVARLRELLNVYEQERVEVPNGQQVVPTKPGTVGGTQDGKQQTEAVSTKRPLITGVIRPQP